MGALGLALYYGTYFALPAALPDLNYMTGDWVWPTIIMVGLTWSLSFLFAGRLNLLLVSKKMPTIQRRIFYVLVLWSWAYLLWLLVLLNK